MGLFIVCEGIEGCGKSTQVTLLASFLEKRKLDCVVTREPGGTPVGEKIRGIFVHSDNKEILPLTELLLVTAARVQHVNRVIVPALNSNKIVLCDRFFDATVAYQGYAGGVDLPLIHQSHELFLNAIRPNLTILFDCPVETGLARSRSRNKAHGIEREEGRFEDKTLLFHEKVRKGYLSLAEQEPARFAVIDALQSVEAVHGQVCRAVIAALKEHGYAL